MQIISDTNEKFVYTSNDITTTIEKIGEDVYIREYGYNFESYNKWTGYGTFEDLVTSIKGGGVICGLGWSSIQMLHHIDKRFNHTIAIRGFKPRRYKN